MQRGKGTQENQATQKNETSVMSASFIPDNSENGRKIKIINILLMHTHTCAHAHTYKTLIFMHLFHIKMRAQYMCVREWGWAWSGG